MVAGRRDGTVCYLYQHVPTVGEENERGDLGIGEEKTNCSIMIQNTIDKILKQEMLEELTTHILPYWMERMVDQENGGFYGRITGQEERMPQAEKGAILHARILWTYSAAYRLLGKEEYKEMATRAERYLIARFYDPEFGGVYWSLDYRGEPLDTKKQIYAIGFAIYGLSEYHRATGDPGSIGVCRPFVL